VLFWRAIIAAETPPRPQNDFGGTAHLDVESRLVRAVLERCAGFASSDNLQDHGMTLAAASPSGCPR
jgi:hypothetical protein